MIQFIRSLIKSLSSKTNNPLVELNIPLTHFDNDKSSEDFCIDILKKGIADKDAGIIQEVLFVQSKQNYKSNELSALLSSILSLNWHYSHEDIAMMLKDCLNSDTVNDLYNSAELKFDYLNYDDTFQFSRKCIKALSAIADTSSIENLWKLSKSENEVISAYAKKELRYKHLLT